MFRNFSTVKFYGRDNVIDFSLDILDITWSNPKRQKFPINVIANVIRLGLILLCLLCFVELFNVTDMWMFSSVFEGMMTAVLVTNDQICGLAIYHSNMIKLLQEMENFWNPTIVDRSDASGSQKLSTRILKILKVLGLFMTSLCIVYTICTLYLKILPLECWTPKTYPSLFNAILIFQAIWTVFGVASAYGVLCLFVGIGISLSIQYRLLNHLLKSADGNIALTTKEKNEQHDIKTMVKYHIFLLEFSYEFRRIFSLHFFVRIIAICGTMCVGLYISTATSSDSSTIFQKFRSLNLFIASFLQFALECFVAQMVSNEFGDIHTYYIFTMYAYLFANLTATADNVGYAAFSSNWYSCPEISTYIILMICRTNRPVIITAGGVVPVNKPTLTAVLKNTLSYLTALRTMATK